MEGLIEALQIFLKYGNVTFPTHCEHDVLFVYGYDANQMSNEDVARLDELGFSFDYEDQECFYSNHYGSC